MKRTMTVLGLAIAMFSTAAAVAISVKNPTPVVKGDGNPPPCSPAGCGNGGH